MNGGSINYLENCIVNI